MSVQATLPVPSHNAKRLLLAGFMAIFAAGVGTAVRGGIFANWAKDFGFTAGQLGEIGGAGFTGFCFGIFLTGMMVDKIGYGWMIGLCFLLHVVSALVTFCATAGMEQHLAFNYLLGGMFIFAFANGGLEGVANPLVSTLFPQDRTHYLNILHASWPAGLAAGAALGWWLGGGEHPMSWKMQLGTYLIPTAIYGLLFIGQRFPKSEAALKRLPIGEMFKDIGILGGLVACALLTLFFSDFLSKFFPAQTAAMVGYCIGGALLLVVGFMTSFALGAFLLFTLFITHALVGAVELGTDSWIQNITGNFLSPDEGKILLVFTSLVMCGLRFTGHWAEKTLRVSPVGLLIICSAIAVIGLNLASTITTFTGALLALFVYSLGKTFFWPTMLAIVGDRFPRSGAIAMSIMGGIGMMSAGLIGSHGLGYAKDRFAGQALQASLPDAYSAYSASVPSSFLGFETVHGLDGKKLGDIQTNIQKQKDGDKTVTVTPTEQAVAAASVAGDRKTLVADSFIPGAMTIIFILILLYFKSIGGYKTITIANQERAEAP